MQSVRTNIRRLPQHLHRITKPSTISLTKPSITTTTPSTRRHFHLSPATMSLFPRFTQEISPLFRLFDDYERQLQSFDNRLRSFSPKFDVKETRDAYELHGEFPGVEQKDINIEWTDQNTLTIHGRHEEVKERGQRPQGFIEEEGKKKERQPSVEEEGAEQTQVAKTGTKEVAKRGEPETKYWVSERSVGEFHRSFAFPAAVDQDNVKASLKNGILSIIVPKSRAPQPRRIQIES
ncbi:HSP20-like chaperone [Westerdykella ornata]|uniref:HSP20-like chaperone n=1 Tax=Westerdykella ornata TaxID=318751 RepID=A0A6A6JYJ7_WESOR|nr:HSP20-like chaperone [Westerdykella ornata]KAF2280918.1 HSP20-like chaperone [Westerdykella ornata]